MQTNRQRNTHEGREDALPVFRLLGRCRPWIHRVASILNDEPIVPHITYERR